MNEELISKLKNHKNITEKTFIKYFRQEYDDLILWQFPTGFKFSQKLYHYINNDKELSMGLCLHCGKRCKFISLNQGYSKYCSNKCAFNSDDVKNKIKNILITKYGVDNAFKSEDIKIKIKKTNLKHYGVEYSLQNNIVREKGKQTKRERYGDENYNNMKKNKQTKKERYGDENYNNLESAKKTNLKKYGVEYGLQDKSIREKGKQTKRERYGDENYVNTEKGKQTKKERYGNENYNNRDKSIKTTLRHYGVVSCMMSDVIKEKTRRTKKERYDDENYNNRDKYVRTCLKKYGVPYACMRSEARCHSNDSKPNIKFAELLKKNNVIDYEREFPLKRYSYDFKISDVLIELNPTITHNSYLNIFGRNPIDKTYHINKSNIANEHGYKCIHVWDWDDIDKIVNMLKPKETLYARNLKLKEVTEKECDEFLNLYHLQNTCKGQIIRYGLYKGDTLIQIMTFGKPRYNKNYEWELLRLCTHKDYKVVGGAEKLFKHFMKTGNPKSVISYCDKSKFNGDVYFKLKFSLKSESSPGKHWYNIKTKQHITDNLLRQRGFDQLFNTNYGKGTSNEELMINHGFLPVYDCGQIVFVWFGSDSTLRKEELMNPDVPERVYSDSKNVKHKKSVVKPKSLF